MNNVELVVLRGTSAEQRIDCRHPIGKPKGLVLNNLMHFKNHVQTTMVYALSLIDYTFAYINKQGK